MILRTARRKFHKILVNTPLHRTAAAISHFLNCLLVNDKQMFIVCVYVAYFVDLE